MSKIGKTGRAALIAAALATTLGACSTKPRNFAASVSSPVPDRVTFEQDYRTCDSLVRAGHSGGFKTAATTTAITAGAVGAGAGVAALGAGGTYSSFGAAGAAAGAVMAAATVVTGLAGFVITRAIRGGRERKFKRNMTACLSEYGYEVADWERLKKREDAAAFASRQVDLAQPDRPEPVMIDAIVADQNSQPVESEPATVAVVTPEP